MTVAAPPRTEIVARPIVATAARVGGTLLALVVAQQLLGTTRLVGLAADAITVVFVIYLVRHLLFLSAAFEPTAAAADTTELPDAPAWVGRSAAVLVPCHDEALVLHRLVAALDQIEAPDGGLQVVLVDDRSSDATPALVDEAVSTRPGWHALHRTAADAPGKSAALNDALALVDADVVVVFDADHHPHREAVRRLVRHFDDPDVGAVQGRCIVRNPGESPLARLVALDYLCGYLVNMVGRQALFSLPAYGGANCAVRTSDLRAVGGWNEASVTEDTDLTIRLVLAGRSVRYDVTALDSEQAVSSLPRFWRQRYRWARGHQQVCADQRLAVATTRHLSFVQRIESLLFLFSFHIPAVCLVALVLVAGDIGGVLGAERALDPWPLIPLMLAAPMVEIGGGLALAGVTRRRALDLLLFPILYVVSMGTCTKALLDRWLGRRYGWQKTTRSLSTPVRPIAEVAS